MQKLTRILFAFLVILFLLVSCSKNSEMKMIIFSENHKNIIENINLHKSYAMEIIDKGNFQIIQNISEEVLLDFLGIAHLKLDVIAGNIANVNTENYVRKFVRISVENGVEIVNDTEGVDLTKETIDMIEIQRFYEATIEYLNKINQNIVFM